MKEYLGMDFFFYIQQKMTHEAQHKSEIPQDCELCWRSFMENVLKV